jgi:hypothetical protein
MQDIPVIQDKIKLNSKREVMKLFLYTKLLESNIKCSHKELEVLMELYEFGGYHNQEQEALFFAKCIDCKYRNSDQSIRNVLTRFKGYGVVEKPKIHQRHISTTYLPDIQSDKVGLMFFVSNAN